MQHRCGPGPELQLAPEPERPQQGRVEVVHDAPRLDEEVARLLLEGGARRLLGRSAGLVQLLESCPSTLAEACARPLYAGEEARIGSNRCR